MGDYAISRLFGIARPAVVETPVKEEVSGSIKLQQRIDTINFNIKTWSEEKELHRKNAIKFRNKKDMVTAAQHLSQMKTLESQISLALTGISQLRKQQSTLITTDMVRGIHDDIKITNPDIRKNLDAVNMDKFQDTLNENEDIEGEVTDLIYEMNKSNPQLNMNDLNNELANLDFADSEEEINYDFPVVVKQPTPVRTTDTTSTTKANVTNSPKTSMFKTGFHA
jgi:hypothetical protein